MANLGISGPLKQFDYIMGPKDISEAEKVKFQKLVLCPRSDHGKAALRHAEEGEGLVLPHDRLVGAAAEVIATTTSSRNRILCT